MGVIQVEKVTRSGEVVKFRMARAILGRPAYFTAAYWVDGLLIDTGCAHTARQLISALKGWRVDRVVNTHSHEDHIGANTAVQEVFHCPIQAHPQALPILRNPRLQKLQLYRRIFWGWPEPCEAGPVGDQVKTERFCLQVIHTPGHSPGHICLFEPEQGWLFSGDTYIGGKDRALRDGYDIHGILQSLKQLATLPVQTILSGSGTVRENGTQPIEDKIAYLEELGERIRALHEQGLSARRIRRRVFGPDLPITFVTLGHFSSMHLVRSYLAGFAPKEDVDIAPEDTEGQEAVQDTTPEDTPNQETGQAQDPEPST